MGLASVSGIVSRNAVVSHWPIFFSLSLIIAQGAFYSAKTSGLNFRQFPAQPAKRRGISGRRFSPSEKIRPRLAGYFQQQMKPQNRTTSRGIPRFSRNFSRKFSFHSTLLPEFQKFSVKWFPFWKFNSFRNIWKLFRQISVPSLAASIYSKVFVEWKTPQEAFGIFNQAQFPPVLKWRYGTDYGTCIKLFAHFFHCTPATTT